MNVIVGKNSRLSNAFYKILPDSRLICKKELNKFLQTNDIKTVIYCSAITDPKCDKDLIFNENYYIPIKFVKKYPKIKFIFFGTAINIHKFSVTNHYAESKKALLDYLKSTQSNYIYFILNTLYGIGFPKEHMFLNDLYKAIMFKKNLLMNNGLQLREYHHYDDVSRIILDLINKQIIGSYEVSHGNPIDLKVLASSLFKKFDLNNKIIFQNTFTNEKYYKRQNLLPKNYFRDPVEGIFKYFNDLTYSEI